MARGFGKHAIGLVTLIGLAGCSSLVTQERPPWRAQAENACLARGVVQDSQFLVSAREISGPGICGLTHPFKVTALAGGTVTINSTQTLDCPMIEALDSWIKDIVQPAALARFNEPVVRINAMGSYSCRGINNMSGASLSEHAFGNALDIGGFVLASGRVLSVMRGFNGQEEQESAFLHEAHAGACGLFTTVLGPGYNILHYNHIHVDLAMHGTTSRGLRRYCKPVPKSNLPEPPQRDNLPDPPAIEEEMDIARASAPEPAVGMGGSSLVASAPPPMPTSRAAAYTPVARRPSLIAARAIEPPVERQNASAPGEEPPRPVTFAVDDPPAEPAPAPRDAPRRRTAAEPAPGADQGTDSGEDRPAADIAVADPDAGNPPPRPRASVGAARAAEWDVTSSIGR